VGRTINLTRVDRVIRNPFYAVNHLEHSILAVVG